MFDHLIGSDPLIRRVYSLICFAGIYAILCGLILLQRNEYNIPLIDLYVGLKLAYIITFLGSIACLGRAISLMFQEENQT